MKEQIVEATNRCVCLYMNGVMVGMIQPGKQASINKHLFHSK